MTVECDICGGEFETAQGLAGHKQFKHADMGPGGAVKESKTITRAQPLDIVIENLRLPQVPEMYNGNYHVYVAGFNDGVMHGARSILAGIRAAQELSTIGVQQATPLIKMAQEMRHAEGQAAEQLATQLSQLTMQSNQQILNAIHGLEASQGQPPPSDTNPMMQAFAGAVQPFMGQILQRTLSGLIKVPQSGGAPAQSPGAGMETQGQEAPAARRGKPSRYIPAEEEEQWTEA